MSVSVSRFKAKLGRYMRTVRSGHEVIITDRGAPVARLVGISPPAERVHVVIAQPRDAAAPPLGATTVRSILATGTDTTAMLGEDRGRR